MENYLAGAGAGVITLYSMYPTEYVKSRMQFRQTQPFFIKNIYKGVLPLAISMLPRASCNYGIFHTINNKKIFKSEFHNNLLSGITSGFFSGLLLTTPAENLKTYQISTNKRFLQSIKDLYAQNGYRTFFNGLYPTLAKETITYGTKFTIYSQMMLYLGKERNAKNICISSFIGGFVSAILSNPLDVIQTRIQQNNGDTGKISFKDAYKGCSIRIIRNLPSTFISFYTFEQILYFLRRI